MLGVLNPVSSTFGQYPPTGMSLDAYAASLASKRGLYVEVGMCIGFCMLITREVITRIGMLTEEVERIFFEDEDYCMRAQAAGFRCVVVQSSYVFHAEHRTVSRMGERERIFQRNQHWCEQRWGRRLRLAYPWFGPLEPGSEELRHRLEQALAWARRRAYVYVYCPMATRIDGERLFRSVGLVPHADVHWHPIPAWVARWSAMGAILARQKKRFDIILAPDERWRALMRRFQWLHRAPVVSLADGSQLDQLWQAKAHSPS